MIETLSLSLYESIYIYTHAIIKTTEDIIYLPKSIALHCHLVSSVGSLTMPVGLGCVPGQQIGNSSTLVLAPHLGPRVVVEMHHGKLADFFGENCPIQWVVRRGPSDFLLQMDWFLLVTYPFSQMTTTKLY